MKKKKELVIGIVVIVALAFMFLGIKFLKGFNVFSNNRTLYAQYENIQTLVPGSLVNIRGQQIGVVAATYLGKDLSKVVVEINITDNTMRIPKNSVAKLSADMLGTSAIELVLGNDFSKLLEDQDTITPQLLQGFKESITEKIDPIVFETQRLLTNLNKSFVKVDTALGKDGENITSIMQKMKTSLGTLNSTLKTTDNIMKASAGDLKSILSNVVSITQNLKNSNEKVTNLITNFSAMSDGLKDADIAGVVKSAKESLEGVTKIVDQINNGDGSLHKLIYDKELVTNLNNMIKESESLIKNIEDHPNRYLQFAVFGSKDKGIKLNKKDEKKLKKILDNAPD